MLIMSLTPSSSSSCLGWAVCGGILPQGSMADLWDSGEDAKPRCHAPAILLLTDPRGFGQTGNILQRARPREFQVKLKSWWSPVLFLFIWYVKMWYSLCYSVFHSGIAWIEFLNSNDNLGDIVTHLREGDMKGAQLLWLRYEVKNSFMHSPGHYLSFVNTLLYF